MKSSPTGKQWPTLRRKLAQWYGTAKRDLPWRRTTDPYAINDKLLEQRIIGGFPLKKFYPELNNASLWCCTETTAKASIDAVAKEVAL